MSPGLRAEPDQTCALCPRLAMFREENRNRHPDWFNAPVPSFGDYDGRLLIVGLAPGVTGANRTGRPFTGDFAGDLLYGTLESFGYSSGLYDARPDDGLQLHDCLITNAVRCVPPANKPVGAEISTCRDFLKALIGTMARLRVIMVLGRIAHDSVASALDLRRKDVPFGHGSLHNASGNLSLIDSYHCSRYNTNTRRLTPAMFHAVFEEIDRVLGR